eukprot:gene15539-15686_t
MLATITITSTMTVVIKVSRRPNLENGQRGLTRAKKQGAEPNGCAPYLRNKRRYPEARFLAVPLHATNQVAPLNENSSLTRFPALDGLRGIAVILVLFAHFPYIQNSGISKLIWQTAQTLRSGYIGVDLFFVLSGFLITRILIRERSTLGKINLLAFYQRRALRIFPIYYLSLFVCLALFPSNLGETDSLIFYFFNYYHPFHPLPYPMEHTWSLAVEEQFYLIWPAIVAVTPLRWARRLSSLFIPVFALGCAIVLTLTFTPTMAAALIYNSLPTRMLSLSFGAYLAFRESESAPFSRRTCLIISALGLATLALAFVERAEGWISAGGLYWTIALLGYALFAAGAVALVINTRIKLVDRLLSMAWLRSIGRISYGIYLYHLIILFIMGINPANVTEGG